MPAAGCAALPQGTPENLSFAIVANVAPIMPDVFPVTPNIATVCSKISLILVDVAPLGSRCTAISISRVIAHLAPVLPDVTGIVANITPVLMPVNSVVSNILPVAAQVAILAQRKRRSQHCKHHQSYDSSSHIASLVSGPLGLCDLEHRDIEKVLRQVSAWKSGTIRLAGPDKRN